MALQMNQDKITGVEIDGMYFRIDKINFNDKDFQVIMTGWASKEAYEQGKIPVSEPRAYTWGDYDKQYVDTVKQYAYALLKTHDNFAQATDVLEEGQEPTT